jgi:hypothetical protein
MASVILQGSPAQLAIGGNGGDISGGVVSVAAGTYMSNSGSASAVVLNSTLVAGDGIEISAGVLNSVSVNLEAGAGITITPPAGAGDPITVASNLVAGAGITITPPAAAGDPITIAAQAGSTGFIRKDYAQSPIPASPASYPTQAAKTVFGLGSPFTPAANGYYAVQFVYNPDVTPTVWGIGDVLQIELVQGGVMTTTYVNFFGPTDGSGLQTIESQTLLANLNGGSACTFRWWVINESGSLNLGGGEVTATIYSPN